MQTDTPAEPAVVTAGAKPPRSGRRVRSPEKRAADALRRAAVLRAAVETPLPDTGYVGPEALCARLGPIAVATLNDWIKEGKVPPPRKLSAKTRVWPVEEVRELLSKFNSGAAA